MNKKKKRKSHVLYVEKNISITPACIGIAINVMEQRKIKREGDQNGK